MNLIEVILAQGSLSKEPVQGHLPLHCRFPVSPLLVASETQMASDASTIPADLLNFFALPEVSDDDFKAMALRLFAHQVQHNLPFQRFCQLRGKTPRTVKHWHDIPAVPINAFKDLTLSCVPPDTCARVFMTSGTTRGDVKGHHHHPALEVYDSSMRLNFAQQVMQGQTRIRMGVLFPDEVALPHSSLAHYLQLALTHFGTADSGYFMGALGLDIAGLSAALQQAQDSGQPFALLGASYSLVHAMDALAALGQSFKLPAGSWLFDTGGFKGQSREIDMDAFYDQLSATFGVPRTHCINMYGMTELSTQFYDRGNATVPSVKRGPHWIRSRVIDPISGREMPRGERGILVHTDLGNYNAVTTILTEDVGVATDDGFVLLGRAQGAQAKGCSLAVEDFLKAARA